MQKKIRDPRDNMANRERAKAAKLQTLYFQREKLKNQSIQLPPKYSFIIINMFKTRIHRARATVRAQSDDFKNIKS